MSQIAITLRIAYSIALVAWLVGHGSGCNHLLETNAINHFMSAIESQDLDKLRSATSSEFEQKALRLDQSMKDLKVLKLPKGKAEILQVVDTDDDSEAVTEKSVTAEVGTTKRKLKYKLVKDPESRKWVVDDVYMKQTQPGLVSAKSVTEQMNLLLSVREFLSAWRDGTPDQIVAVTGRELSTQLRALDADYLTWLARTTVGRKQSKSQLRPKAQMDEEVAIVRVPTAENELAISFRLEDGSWKVTNASIESQSSNGRIKSVRDLAKVIAAAVRFLDSYEAADKQSLADVTTDSFYRGSLMPADLTSIRLPSSSLSEEEFEIDVHGKHCDFIVKNETQWLKLTLVNQDDNQSAEADHYVVADVTIYELNSQQEKRLSALFTSQAVVRLFSQALQDRDLTLLSHSATPDFNRRVWSKLDQQTMRQMSLEGIEPVPPRVISTDFQGVVSEVWVTQGQRALSYVLHDHNGRLLVHDVHVSATEDRPSSLKTRLELLLPVWNFVRGIQTRDLNLIREAASGDFNQLVWQQVDSVPEISTSVPDYLAARLTSVRMNEEQVVLVLGDEARGAEITLVNEGDRYSIDEINLIAGPAEQQRAKLKHSLRYQVVSIRKESQQAKSRMRAANANAGGLSSPASRQQSE